MIRENSTVRLNLLPEMRKKGRVRRKNLKKPDFLRKQA